MKKNIALLFILVTSILYAPDTNQQTQAHQSELISFNFSNEALVDVINQLASQKGVNVILPAEPMEEKVTVSIDEKISLTRAWHLLYNILDVAGYSMIQRKNSFQVIKADPKTVSSEPAPIFINTPVSEIPSVNKPIRYLYFFTNVQITKEGDHEVRAILNNLLDPKQFQVNPQTNSVLITANANKIRAIMELLNVLDSTEYKETVDLIKLQYVDADIVSKTLNELIKPIKTPRRYPIARQPEEDSAEYFSRFLKIKPVTRTNALLVLGKPQAIERLRRFVYKYIDIELESGRSILHTYQLQYLDANDFAEVLKRVVASRQDGTGQAEGKKEGGPVRFFKDVIITTDRIKQEESPTGEDAISRYGGGNKLIVAATSDDWKRIKSLIEQLDKPEPQVIIEVLIADLTLDDTRELGNLIRNPLDLPFPKNVDAQAAMWGQVITGNSDSSSADFPGNQSLQADLLGCNSVTGDSARALPNTVANVPTIGFSPAGTTLVEVSDKETGRTWSIAKLLQLFNADKIVSHPHIITSNNKPATVVFGEERFLRGPASGASGGAINISFDWVDALLQLDIKPRVSGDSVNLTVRITINNFRDDFSATIDDPSGTNAAAQTRTERVLVTNTNVNDGGIVTLGGLERFDTVTSVNQTPILGSIPLLGYFFKDKRKAATETNLTIFISPTIVQPHLRGGETKYTKDYIKVVAEASKEGQLFEHLKDPITHFFFYGEGEDVDEFIDEFVTRYKREPDVEELFLSRDRDTERRPSAGPRIARNESQQLQAATSGPTLVTENTQPLQTKGSKDAKLKDMIKQVENPLLTKQRQEVAA